jgi:hypothetical protein
MIVDLNTVRMLKGNDAQSVSPETLLKHLLAEISAGRMTPTKIAIAWFEDAGESLQRGAAFAGVNRMEALALLEVTKADALEGWRSLG